VPTLKPESFATSKTKRSSHFTDLDPNPQRDVV